MAAQATPLAHAGNEVPARQSIRQFSPSANGPSQLATILLLAAPIICLTVQPATSAVSVARTLRRRVFYASVSIAMILTVLFGFARSYFLRGVFIHRPLSLLLQAHGLAFTTWMALFFTQTVLIANHNVRLHRKLGYFGAVLAALMLILGSATVVDFAHRNAAGGNAILSFLTVPFFDLLLFGVLVAAAIIYRRNPEMHKRLMFIATLNLLGAAIERWPVPINGGITYNQRCVIQDCFLLVGIVYDLIRRKRVHPAYIWAGAAFVISQPLRTMIGQTNFWIHLTSGLIR
jgi:MFS family permease